jgi:hypothetical protein
MQIQNPDRFFVTRRSRIVDIVDEESGRRTITNSSEGGYGSWAPFKGNRFPLEKSRALAVCFLFLPVSFSRPFFPSLRHLQQRFFVFATRQF